MATTENKRELHHINDGAIVSFDLKKNKIDKVIHHGLKQPHIILFSDQFLYFCNSIDCQVKKDKETMIEFQGYIRGLYKKNNIFYVGQSEIRRLSRIENKFSNISRDTGIHIWFQEDCTSFFINIPSNGVFDVIGCN